MKSCREAASRCAEVGKGGHTVGLVKTVRAVTLTNATGSGKIYRSCRRMTGLQEWLKAAGLRPGR